MLKNLSRTEVEGLVKDLFENEFAMIVNTVHSQSASLKYASEVLVQKTEGLEAKLEDANKVIDKYEHTLYDLTARLEDLEAKAGW